MTYFSSYSTYPTVDDTGSNWDFYGPYNPSTTFGNFVVGSDWTCRDPACLFDPFILTEYPDCAGDWWMLNDGLRDDFNNNPACGYDGGDVSLSWNCVEFSPRLGTCTPRQMFPP